MREVKRMLNKEIKASHSSCVPAQNSSEMQDFRDNTDTTKTPQLLNIHR
jgi:hypothetical protein